MPGLVLTPFGLGFPICAVGTQSASPTPVSCWRFRWSQKELGEHGTAESWGCPWDGRRSCCSLPLSLVSRSLQTRPQKHKKMPHHIQAAGPLPHSHPSPCVPPSKPWARPSGLSPQGGAIQSSQSGCCRYQPPPQAGALGVARDCGPGSPSLGPLSHRVPLWSHGEQGRKRRRSTVGAHPTAEAAGAGCANEQAPGRASVRLLLWDLGQASSFSGLLCCKWTRVFQRSPKTDSVFLPQKGVIVLRTAFHADCFLRPQVG